MDLIKVIEIFQKCKGDCCSTCPLNKTIMGDYDICDCLIGIEKAL